MTVRRLFLAFALFSVSGPFIALRAEPKAEKTESAKPASGYVNASFNRLAGYTFPSVIEDDPAKLAAFYNEQIPADVKNLDGKKTVISGFMLPVKVNDGAVT